LKGKNSYNPFSFELWTSNTWFITHLTITICRLEKIFDEFQLVYPAETICWSVGLYRQLQPANLG
jgi:hypothetical protein